MKQQITELLKTAMKEKEVLKVSVYRSLKADIETAEKNGQVDAMTIISKAAKKRSDSIDQYVKAGRQDLADIEKKEFDIISELLPKEPTDEEIISCIRECCGNISMKMGDIIKYIKHNYPTVDGKKTSTMVKEYLSNQ